MSYSGNTIAIARETRSIFLSNVFLRKLFTTSISINFFIVESLTGTYLYAFNSLERFYHFVEMHCPCWLGLAANRYG